MIHIYSMSIYYILFIDKYIIDYIYLIEWLTDCGLGSPIMTVSWWKGWESSSCSVYEARYFGSLVLKCWSLRGLVKSQWSSGYTGMLKKLVLRSAKECLLNSTVEFAIKSNGRKRFPSSLYFYLNCHQKMWSIFREGLPASIVGLRKSFTDCPAAWVWFDFRCSQDDSQD